MDIPLFLTRDKAIVAKCHSRERANPLERNVERITFRFWQNGGLWRRAAGRTG